MKHRNGGKLRGSHTTCSDLSAKVYDLLVDMDEVNGITLGVLSHNKGPSAGRVRLGEKSGSLHLIVRGPGSVQEMFVYSTDLSETRLALSRALRDADISIAFKKD